jgi:plasmid stability protein
MPTLHVRNIPDTLHSRIRQLAKTERCSLSLEVITLLDHAVTERENRLRQRQVLNRIRLRRSKPGKNTPSTLDMLREDRGR